MAALYYGGLGGVMTLIVLDRLDAVLPEPVASRLAHNSEGVLMALLLAAWIQFVRPRLGGGGRAFAVTGAAAALSLLGAVLVLTLDLPSRLVTLNEAFFATALLIPYVQAPRPLGRWPSGVVLALLLVMVLAHSASPVVMLAELLAMLVLAPVGFDGVDRAILDPAARTSRTLRLCWYSFLVAAPATLSALGALGLGGPVGVADEYAIRTLEAFLAMLLLEVYFGTSLGRTGSGTAPPVTSSELEVTDGAGR